MTTNEMKTKHCNTCDTSKTVEAFNKCKSKRDGFQTQCKGCAKTYNQGRYKANREQILEQKKGYRKAKRASMTQAEQVARGSVDLALRRSQLSSYELFGGLTYTEACAMTLPLSELRLKLEAKTGLAHQIDHIVPVAAGGTHTKDNLQVITTVENITKSHEDKLLVAAYTD